MIYSVSLLVLLNMDLVEDEDVDVDVVVVMEPGCGSWQLLAAVGSWQLDVDIACHVCDTHFSLPSSVYSQLRCQLRPDHSGLFCRGFATAKETPPPPPASIFQFLHFCYSAFCFFGVPHASCRASATKSRPCLGRQLPCPCQRGFCRCQRGRYPAEFAMKGYILSEANKCSINGAEMDHIWNGSLQKW